MELEVEHVGIVGTGLIGAGWAAFYAAKGFHVTMFDATDAARESGFRSALDYLASLKDHGVLTLDDHDQAAARVHVVDELGAAVQDAQLVQESVTERYDVKKDIFRQIDRAAPADAVLASSSSGLLISELQTVMDRPGRALIAHPFNPPHLIRLVELVPGAATDQDTLAWAKAFFEGLGKVAVILSREVPGHLANRLQAAVWREAVDLVLNGVASVADVDKALAAGPGLRWALLGPHMIFHLGGGPGGIKYFADHVGAAWTDLWQNMASWTTLPDGAADVLDQGVRDEMGTRSLQEIAQWRDRKIAQLLKTIDAI